MREIDAIRDLIERCVDAGDVDGLRRLQTVINKLAADIAVGLVLVDPHHPSIDDLTNFKSREIGSGLELEPSPPSKPKIDF